MTLQAALIWLSGAGAGVAATFIIRRLDGWVWWGNLRPDLKRYLAFIETAIIACAAYSLMVAFAYQVRPGDAQAWVEALFAVSASAIVAGQVTHGARDLRKRD